MKNSKIYLLVSTEYTNVTDRRTDRQTSHDGMAALMHSIARQKLLLVWASLYAGPHFGTGTMDVWCAQDQ